MNRLLRAAWDRLSLYLPVILMGLLALGTYWLARNAPTFAEPEAQRPASHEPDYFMRKFSVKTFDATGRLKSAVFGDEMHHFPDTETVEISQVLIHSFNAQGRLTVASAKRGLSNADGSEVQLFGNALVVREAVKDGTGEALQRLTLRGEFLHAFMNTERVKSHLPVELTRGRDSFTANEMDFDNLDRVMTLKGRVRGTLLPKAP